MERSLAATGVAVPLAFVLLATLVSPSCARRRAVEHWSLEARTTAENSTGNAELTRILAEIVRAYGSCEFPDGLLEHVTDDGTHEMEASTAARRCGAVIRLDSVSVDLDSGDGVAHFSRVKEPEFWLASLIFRARGRWLVQWPFEVEDVTRRANGGAQSPRRSSELVR